MAKKREIQPEDLPMLEAGDDLMPTDGPDDFETEYPEDFPDYPVFESFLDEGSEARLLEKQEDTRGRLALVYTVATFIIFLLGFAVAVLDAAWRQTSIVDNLSTILPLISGIFLGSLGFVLGYYFRRLESEESRPVEVVK